MERLWVQGYRKCWEECQSGCVCWVALAVQENSKGGKLGVRGEDRFVVND